jgi:hypothetical protein
MITFFFGKRDSSFFLNTSILFTLLWTKNICPPLWNSLSQAFLISASLNCKTEVSMLFLPVGGVLRREILRTPDSARLRLLGIGVALSERISISVLIFLIFSLSLTQNLCSSSTTISPRFLQVSLSERSL